MLLNVANQEMGNYSGKEEEMQRPPPAGVESREGERGKEEGVALKAASGADAILSDAD